MLMQSDIHSAPFFASQVSTLRTKASRRFIPAAKTKMVEFCRNGDAEVRRFGSFDRKLEGLFQSRHEVQKANHFFGRPGSCPVVDRTESDATFPREAHLGSVEQFQSAFEVGSVHAERSRNRRSRL